MQTDTSGLKGVDAKTQHNNNKYSQNNDLTPGETDSKQEVLGEMESMWNNINGQHISYKNKKCVEQLQNKWSKNWQN